VVQRMFDVSASVVLADNHRSVMRCKQRRRPCGPWPWLAGVAQQWCGVQREPAARCVRVGQHRNCRPFGAPFGASTTDRRHALVWSHAHALCRFRPRCRLCMALESSENASFDGRCSQPRT
jgi:hypothetical protein